MNKSQPKQSIISAKKARINFGEILDEAFYNDKEFLVTKKDKPIAVIIGVDHWQKTRQGDAQQKKSQKKVKFPSHHMGEMKIPLTRANLYDERTSRIT